MDSPLIIYGINIIFGFRHVKRNNVTSEFPERGLERNLGIFVFSFAWFTFFTGTCDILALYCYSFELILYLINHFVLFCYKLHLTGTIDKQNFKFLSPDSPNPLRQISFCQIFNWNNKRILFEKAFICFAFTPWDKVKKMFSCLNFTTLSHGVNMQLVFPAANTGMGAAL